MDDEPFMGFDLDLRGPGGRVREMVAAAQISTVTVTALVR